MFAKVPGARRVLTTNSASGITPEASTNQRSSFISSGVAFAVLGLPQHHKTHVLLGDVIVLPANRKQEEERALAGHHRQRSDEQQRNQRPQQPA